jgi:hypothetical protein
MKRERALRIVLVLVGLLFTAGVYPLIGGLFHPADSDMGDTQAQGIARGGQHDFSAALDSLEFVENCLHYWFRRSLTLYHSADVRSIDS